MTDSIRAVELERNLEAERQRNAELQADLERERQRWEENAAFCQERTGELSLSLEELEARLRERTGPNGRNGKAAEMKEQ